MKNYLLGLICFFLVVGFKTSDCRACSTFQLNDNGLIFMGANYDWGIPDGLIIVNPRGLSKTAMPSYRDNSEVGRPAVWTSKYGSITFNQYGREMPFSGINEAGLTIEAMSLGQSRFPIPDSRPSIYMLQWLQYQLDNHARVKEVIQSDSHLRIRPKQGVCIHFLVSDKDGNCCAIEFIDGKQVVHVNETMPHKVLTNSTYDDSIEYLAKDEIPNPDWFKSIERFILAANSLKGFGSETADPPLEYSFSILEKISMTVKTKTWTVRTQCSIVYDVNNRQVYFKTFTNPKIRRIDLKAVDFSCAAPAKVLDMNTDSSGDVTGKFVDYTRQMNRDLTASAFNKSVYLPTLPDEVFDNIAQYPDTFVCDR